MADDPAKDEKPDLQALIAEIAKTDASAFMAALLAGSHGHYQAIYNAGHATATAQAGKGAEAHAAVVAEKEASITQLNEKIEALSQQQPDAAALRQQYEDAASAKETEYQAALAAEREKNSALAKTITERDVDTVQTHIEREIAKHLVDPSLAALYAGRVRDRIRPDGSILQPDKVTPYVAPESKTLAEIVAATEIMPAIPKVLIKPNGAASTGTGDTGTGQPLPSSLTKKSFYTDAGTLDVVRQVKFINEHGGGEKGTKAFQALPDA